MSNAILNKSLGMARDLLPNAKADRKTKNKFFHFCFGFHKNKLISIGQNNTDKTHTRCYRMRKRFGLDAEYPFIHAEVDMLSKLWGKVYIDNRLKVVVIRLNKHGELRNSKPCCRCSQILAALNINKVWWSTDYGFEKQSKRNADLPSGCDGSCT